MKTNKYIYLCHPITLGTPELNIRNAIDAREEILKLKCHAFVAILNIMAEVVYPKTHAQYLKEDLAWPFGDETIKPLRDIGIWPYLHFFL